MTDGNNFKKKTKKKRSVSAFSMALSGVRRSWKKSLAVVISLALSLMVLNMTYMIVNGFDFDSYTSTLISADFEVNNFTTTLDPNNDLNCITPQFRDAVAKNKDIAAAGYVYWTKSTHNLDDQAYQWLENVIKQSDLDQFNSQQQADIESALTTHTVTSHVMGINEAAFDKLVFDGAGCTWEEFASGKYVITNGEGAGGYNHVGDLVNVEFSGDNSKAYQVIALASLPFTLSYYYYEGVLTQTFLLPETEYQAGTGNVNAMIAALDTKSGKMQEVGEWLSAYLEDYNNSLVVNSRYELQQEFKSYVNKYYMIGGMLTAVLFIIGILNFFNMSATSILSRKKELSLLEVVGMTKRQILKMLITEGILNFGISFVLATTVGTVVAKQLVTMAVGDIFFFDCRISILPSILVIPVMLLIAFLIPVYNYKKMCKETVVERIRNVE